MKIPITIASRFCGPPASGNGGYTSGLLASKVDYPCRVNLRKPPPLDTEMTFDFNQEGGQLLHGDLLIATVTPYTFELEVPMKVSVETAAAVEKDFFGMEHSPFPTCFVCGKDRDPKDALCIHPGAVAEGVVAAAWTPALEFGDAEGLVPTTIVWSALDCPGAWSIIEDGDKFVLGQLAVNTYKEIKVQEPHVAIGWFIKSEGRKTWTGTAILDENQEVCAVGEGLWISI